jgi:hypothetical protein
MRSSTEKWPHRSETVDDGSAASLARLAGPRLREHALAWRENRQVDLVLGLAEWIRCRPVQSRVCSHAHPGFGTPSSTGRLPLRAALYSIPVLGLGIEDFETDLAVHHVAYLWRL